VVTTDDGEVRCWTAEHTGYERLEPPVTHRRTVELDVVERRLSVVDRVESTGSPAVRMAFHFGPTIEVALEDHTAALSWSTPAGRRRAKVTLPSGLGWTVHRGEISPILGWYSERFGLKEPTSTVLGVGWCSPGNQELRSAVEF
jgi:hypothetical protein